MLPANNTYAKFLETQVHTTPPEKLILMCYDGIIRFCNRAIESLRGKNLPAAHENILRAEAIVTELRVSLRQDAGEIAGNLDRIYDFVYSHLVEANFRKDPRKLREVIEVITPLSEAWAEACAIVAQPQSLGKV